MAELTFDGVTKTFGATAAVADLSLTVGDGEFVVILGPTGAGKTTTLRLAAGLEQPDHGSIHIAGQDVTTAPPAARDVCFVFQQYSLYPHYSVFDNMAFPLRAPGRKLSRREIDGRVREIAKMLRIEDKLKNKATQLSGGEMQRVAIGRALVRSPTAYLMDEPLSSLDAKLREDLRIELKRIQRELGATMLYVTHDQLEAMTLADRIGILSDGRLAQVGTPRQVYEQPANIYVAQRLGSPQINLLPAGEPWLKDVPGQAETVGVRAEDIVLNQAGGPAAKVLSVQHLGVETVVLLQVGARQINALVGHGDAVHKGDEITIAVRPEGELFFDADGRLIPTKRSQNTTEAAYGT